MLCAGTGIGDIHSPGDSRDGWLHRHDQRSTEPALPAARLSGRLHSVDTGQLAATHSSATTLQQPACAAPHLTLSPDIVAEQRRHLVLCMLYDLALPAVNVSACCMTWVCLLSMSVHAV